MTSNLSYYISQIITKFHSQLEIRYVKYRILQKWLFLKGRHSETTGTESINGQGYCLTDKSNPNQLLILLKVDPHKPSVILQVNSSTQLQPIRSLIGVL